MSLQRVLAEQKSRGLDVVHLALVTPECFYLGHTDDERACGANNEDCEVHRWLEGHSRAPADPGLYVVVPYQPDLDSESYPVPPYELIPADLVDVAALTEERDDG